MNDNNEQMSLDTQSELSPGPTLIMITRDYSLNIDKTLKTKLDACDSVNVSYEVKGGGVTGNLDTASFEILRAACSTFYKNLPASEGKCVINVSEDKKCKAQVQQTYKVTRQQDGHEVSYTLNLYPTKNSLLLNGKDTDTFIDSHLPTIHQLMGQTVQEWEVESLANLNNILSEQFTRILEQRQPGLIPDHVPTDTAVSSPANEHETGLKSRDSVEGGSREILGSNRSDRGTRRKNPPKKYGEYFEKAETGDDGEKCSSCKRNCVTRGAKCSVGNHRIHYHCDKLTKEEEKRLAEDKGFIYVCKACRSNSDNTELKTVVTSADRSGQALQLPHVPRHGNEGQADQTTAELLLQEENQETCYVCHENMEETTNRCDLCSGLCGMEILQKYV